MVGDESQAPRVRTAALAALGYFSDMLVAEMLGSAFTAMALKLRRDAERRTALKLYLFSLAYLALLFAAMAIDHLV